MTAPEQAGERVAAMQSVCDEISRIMETYREQEANGGVDTPGGLEHMGDVWRLLSDWDDQLRAAALRTPAPADVTDGDVRDVADAIVSWVIGPTEPGADELLAYISSVILAREQAAVARERALVEALSDIMLYVVDEHNADPAEACIRHWWQHHAEALKNVPRPGSPERDELLKRRAAAIEARGSPPHDARA